MADTVTWLIKTDLPAKTYLYLYIYTFWTYYSIFLTGVTFL